MAVQKFVAVYGEFLTDLKRAFPDKVNGNLDKGVKGGLSFFVRNQLPWMTYISSVDEDWLVSKGGGILMLIDGVSFADVFSDENCNEATKEVIWTYLHSLFVVLLGVNRDVVNKILESTGENADGEVWKGIEETYSLQADILVNIKQYRAEKKEAVAEAEKAVEADKEARKVAKEARKVTKEAKKSGAGSGGGAGSGSGSGDGADDSNPFMNKKSKEFLENSTIGALAKELQSEIDINELPAVSNPEDMLSQLTGDGGGAMFKVMGKVMSKMDEKMKSGQLNHQTLMNEAGSLMGMMMGSGNGGGDSNPMAAMMGSLMGGMGGGSGGGGGNPLAAMMGGGGGSGGGNPMMDLMSSMMGGDNKDTSISRPQKKKKRRSKRRSAALKARKMKKKIEKAASAVAPVAKVEEVEEVEADESGSDVLETTLDTALDGILDGMDDDQTFTAGELRRMLHVRGDSGSEEASAALEVPDEMRKSDSGEAEVTEITEESGEAEAEAEESTPPAQADGGYGTEDSDGSDNE